MERARKAPTQALEFESQEEEESDSCDDGLDTDPCDSDGETDYQDVHEEQDHGSVCETMGTSKRTAFPIFEKVYRKAPRNDGSLVFGRMMQYRFSESFNKANLDELHDMPATCAFFEIFITGALEGYSFRPSIRWQGTCNHDAVHEGVRGISIN
jgi:hypothetical protein